MKKIIPIILILISLLFIKIPNYVELNNLAIIEKIGIQYQEKEYTIWLKEIIPLKAEQGIDYEYHYYKGSASSLKKALQQIERNTKKKIYLKKTKLLVTNLTNSKPTLKFFKINPKRIQHTTKDVNKVLKDN